MFHPSEQHVHIFNMASRWGAPKEGGGGCRTAVPLQTLQNRNLENTYFAGYMISKVLHDFPFSRNQPLKSADDYYIRIVKNELLKLR
jgi:hypothetical protein